MLSSLNTNNNKGDNMSKQAKLIRVNAEDWKLVRVAAIQAGMSTGDFLVHLFRLSKIEVAARPEDEIGCILPGTVVKVSAKVFQGAEEVKVETPRERMKRLHPRDTCLGCGKYNKDCTCAVQE